MSNQLHLFVLVMTLLTHCCTARPQFFSFIPYVTSVETSPPQPMYSQVPQNIAAVSPQFYQAVTPTPPKQGPVRLLFLSFTRFPWPVENWVQRLQNFFSTYTVTQEPLLIEEVDLGPDLVPVDELEPEQNGSRPPSSPGVLTIELPNPAWSTSQFNLGPDSNVTGALTSIDQLTPADNDIKNQTMMQEEMPNPSWPSTSDVTPTTTTFQETTEPSVNSNTLRNIERP